MADRVADVRFPEKYACIKIERYPRLHLAPPRVDPLIVPRSMVVVALCVCVEQKRGYKDQWPFSVRIYKDDSTGKPKGDCIIKYEEPSSAHAALKWFDGVEFKGGKIGVAMAAKPSLNNRY